MYDEHPPSSSAEHASLLFHELISLLIRRSTCEILATMTEAGLSMPQMVTLSILNHHGPHSISAIAAKLNLSLAATSQLVDRIVKQALVLRDEDASDRRHKRVMITPTGRALIERLVQARSREVAQSLAGLPPALQTQLETVLNEVIARLKEQAE